LGVEATLVRLLAEEARALVVYRHPAGRKRAVAEVGVEEEAQRQRLDRERDDVPRLNDRQEGRRDDLQVIGRGNDIDAPERSQLVSAEVLRPPELGKETL
jgi:hypothetical protein